MWIIFSLKRKQTFLRALLSPVILQYSVGKSLKYMLTCRCSPVPIKHPFQPAIKNDFYHESLLFHYRKADDKIVVCKFKKNAKSKIYHTEN